MKRLYGEEELMEIFSGAAEIEDVQVRKAYLDEVCSGKEPLRQRIEELLAAERESGPPPEISLYPRTGGTRGLGQRIGPYTLVKKLGEGGYGTVFMAQQEKPLRRTVALKVIKLGMDTRRVIARFDAERQALAMMTHSGIAQVFDAGATDSGRPYFVMELVQGIKVTHYCSEKRLSLRQRLEIVIQICHAIQHAHEKGIIHRDLKPSNILVAERNGQPEVKIIDFGIAKATARRLIEETLATAFEDMIGTPTYMSPEQMSSRTAEIDHRSDVYSLGVLLYELLTGTTPHHGKDLLGAGIEQMRQIICETAPVWPSAKIGQLSAEVAPEFSLLCPLPSDLDWVAMKCLEKDRRRRYQTAHAFAEDLQRYLDNQPVRARPPSRFYELKKTLQRHKAAFGAATMVGAALAVGIVISSWQAIRATRASVNERMAREAADRNATLALTNELAARRISYNSDMDLAGRAIQGNDLGLAQRLLQAHLPEPERPDLRHWEWRALWKLCQSDAVDGFANEDPMITSMDFSPDGRWLATGSERGAVKIWDRAKRVEAKTLLGFWDVLIKSQVAFSPHGNRFYAGSQSGKVRCYSVPGWEELSWQADHGDFMRSMALSRDGTLLVIFGGDHAISLWDTTGSTPPRRLQLDRSTVIKTGVIALAPDKDWLAIGQNKVLRVWDLNEGYEIRRIPCHELINAIDISPDGMWIASGTGYSDSTISLWNVEDATKNRKLEGHTSYLMSLRFSPDGQWLASASGDQTVRLWRTSDWEEAMTLRGHQGEVRALAFASESDLLVSAARDAEFLVWKTQSKAANDWPFIQPDLYVWSATFASNSRTLVTVNTDGTVTLRDTDRFQVIEQYHELGRDNTWVTCSPRKRWWAVSKETGVMLVFDPEKRQIFRKLEGKPGARIYSVGFSNDGGKLLGLTSDRGFKQCVLWDADAGTTLRTWELPLDTVALTLSPEAKFVATGHRDGCVRLWDVAGGKEVVLGDLHQSPVRTIRFLPDGKRVAAANTSGDLKIWDPATGELVDALDNMHMLAIRSLAFSPDGERMLTGGGANESVKIWDLKTRRHLMTLIGRGFGFAQVEMSSDDSAILAVNGSGQLHLWRVPSWKEIQAAEADSRRSGEF